MVRVVVVRIGVPVLADEEAPAWARRKQVHLVRFDEHRACLSPQSVGNTREVSARVHNNQLTEHADDAHQAG